MYQCLNSLYRCSEIRDFPFSGIRDAFDKQIIFAGIWGLMHRNVTHNKCYAKFNDFCAAVLGFLRDEVRKNWQKYADSVTDNFRVINPKDFRVLA